MADKANSTSRRNFLKTGLIAISTASLAGESPALRANPRGETAPHFLNESERRFLQAAVERLIPADEKWPGAAEAEVVNYIDLQMAGQWGKGEMIYRHGPFRKGTPSQGYQLEYTPAELFRRSIVDINAHGRRGTGFRWHALQSGLLGRWGSLRFEAAGDGPGNPCLAERLWPRS